MADKKISALMASTVPLAGTEVLPIVQSSTTKQVSIANVTAGRAVSSLTTTALGPNGIPITLQEITALPSSSTTAHVGVSTSAFPGGANGDLILIPRTSSNNDVRVYVGSGTPAEALVVQGSTKDVRVQTGNLVIGTSGKGIDFSATTQPAAGMTSELLADYEEGTWTPVLVFGSGSTGITYSTQQGTYTKVGRTVTIRFEISLSSKGSSTGEASITGLPFASANLNSMSVYLYSNFLLTYKAGIAYCNSTTINEIAANGTAAFTDVQFTNTSRFWATCTYQV
jgi:hypothetical protein